MDQFTRFLILGVLGVGVFSIIASGLSDLFDGQLLKGLVMMFFGAFLGAGEVKFDRDYLHAPDDRLGLHSGLTKYC